MPEVEIAMGIRAPAQRVWQTVLDIESYPSTMENVRSVQICERISSTEHRSAWSIALKGAILEWVEHDVVDHGGMVMSFSQVSGDLSMFEGQWRLVERSPELTEVSFEVVFEIGIPLLAEMLNPVARRSLQDNCAEMLHGVERQALTA
jgi:ribosome-associated toxin RatA of RatAB toxin-antitoxin module